MPSADAGTPSRSCARATVRRVPSDVTRRKSNARARVRSSVRELEEDAVAVLGQGPGDAAHGLVGRARKKPALGVPLLPELLSGELEERQAGRLAVDLVEREETPKRARLERGRGATAGDERLQPRHHLRRRRTVRRVL